MIQELCRDNVRASEGSIGMFWIFVVTQGLHGICSLQIYTAPPDGLRVLQASGLPLS